MASGLTIAGAKPPAAKPAAAKPAAAKPAAERDAAGGIPSDPPPPRLRPTVLGGYIVAVGAALISAPRWLPQPTVITLGVALLATMALAAWLAPRRLGRVSARWLVPQRLHAGEEVAIGAELDAGGGAPPLTIEAFNPATRRRERVARVRSLGATPARTHWDVRFPRRGLVRLPPLVARSDQPFGLAMAARAISPPVEVLVLPALGALRQAFHARLRSYLESHAATSDPGDDEIAHLRPYRAGDPPNRIHWRATARNRHLLVTERHALGCRRLSVVIDLDAANQDSRRVERLICAAATIIDDLCARGWTVTLHGPGAGGPDAAGPGGIDGGRDRLLEALALATVRRRDLAELIPPGRPALVLALRAAEFPGLVPRPLVLHGGEIDALVSLPRRWR